MHISKNFLDSLYNTIRQKLPQKYESEFKQTHPKSSSNKEMKDESHSHQVSHHH